MQYAGISADILLGTRRAVMRAAIHVVVIGCVLFSGCGSGRDSEVGFINETQHSEAELWSLWKAAQTSLSHQIDLNPLQRQFSGVGPNLLRVNRGALSVSPHQLVISSQPDSSLRLFMRPPARTGLIPLDSLFARSRAM